MSLSSLLVHTCDVEGPSLRKVGSGTQRFYPPEGGSKKHKDVKCRFNQLSAVQALELMQRGVTATHRVYFDAVLSDLADTDRLAGKDGMAGRYFEVVSWGDTDELGRLFVVDCRERK